ncbi:Hcp family type VI secretion system effector [Burkholderiaceae bacterium UC74_6]
MDLILFQPGDASVFPAPNSFPQGGSLIDGKKWMDDSIKLGQCIELVSVHQGMKQQVTTDVSNSARTSGRPVITEFTCVKYVDKTSVKMYEYCLRAQPLGTTDKNPSFLYILRNSGDKTANIITFTLRDALITELQFQSHPDDMPTEQFKLNFTEILWTYNVQTAEMKTLGAVTTGWSLARNRPIAQLSPSA